MLLHKYDDEPPDEFEDEREDAFEDCRVFKEKSSVKRRAEARAKRISSRRQFAIDQQNAKQNDMFGESGESADKILDDLLAWRKECFSEPSFPNDNWEEGGVSRGVERGDFDGPLLWDNGEFYKDDVPF